MSGRCAIARRNGKNLNANYAKRANSADFSAKSAVFALLALEGMT